MILYHLYYLVYHDLLSKYQNQKTKYNIFTKFSNISSGNRGNILVCTIYFTGLNFIVIFFWFNNIKFDILLLLLILRRYLYIN